MSMLKHLSEMSGHAAAGLEPQILSKCCASSIFVTAGFNRSKTVQKRLLARRKGQ